MSKHAQPPKSKHVKESEKEDVKVYIPKGQLSDEQFAELPEEKTDKKRIGAVHERDFSVGKLILLGAAAAISLAAWFLPIDGWIRFAVFMVPFILVSIDVVFDAAEALLSGNFLDKNIYMSLCAIAAVCIGRITQAIFLMLLYRLGDLLEAYAREKGHKATADILEVRPYSANLETEDGVINVLPEDVRPGDTVVVEPGDCIALDGVIIEGMTTVDVSALTGSSKAVTLREGMRVVSGCVNVSKPIRVRVTASYEDSTADKVLRLVEGAPLNLSRMENLIKDFAKIYTPTMLALALLMAVIPSIFAGADGAWRQWIGRGLVLILAANLSPLTASVPLAFSGAVNRAYYKGILFRGTRFVEALARAETMVFNKTGIITEGRYTISDVFPENMTEHELLTIAASAELYSSHPIARALKEACGTLDPKAFVIEGMMEQPGRGVSAFINGRLVFVGNALLLEENNLSYQLPTRTGSAIHVSMDARYCGYIIMNDKVREGTFDALEALRHQGVENMVLLTGDLRTAARLTASSLNFDMVKAELMPESKLSAVEYLMATKADRTTLCCVGDAVSDAEMLKRSNVGVALGALAENGALDTADVIVMANELRKLPIAHRIARYSFKVSQTNMYIAAGEKLVLIILGALGLLPLWMAAVLEMTALAAMLVNSLQTLKNGKTEP